MASEGWADAVPGKTRLRLAPASSWTDFDAVCAASPRTVGLGPTDPPEAMTMRFYTSQHRFYFGVDLYATTLFLHVLDHGGQTRFERNIPARPDRFLEAVQLFRDVWSSAANACSPSAARILRDGPRPADISFGTFP
jgi:hypothetical protein